uniref:Mitochondrial translational initiation factor 3 n=1 Tax=Anas platyrhynchos TaxID=8839 RepID=A0A8B9R3G1_ANAPL
MTTFCVMKLLCHATRNENGYAKRFFGTLLTQTAQKGVFSPFCMVVPDPKKTTVFGLAQPFCMAEKSRREPKQKTAFGSVGRRIPYRILHVLNQDGESLGNMHRADALRLMDQHGLKLVLLRENVDPPVYRLMTGQQIHEEQLKRAEKKKASSKAGLVQKELSFSSAIAKNDLETKTKQIAHWIEKKYHVKVTVRQAKDSNTDMVSGQFHYTGVLVLSSPLQGCFLLLTYHSLLKVSVGPMKAVVVMSVQTLQSCIHNSSTRLS